MTTASSIKVINRMSLLIEGTELLKTESTSLYMTMRGLFLPNVMNMDQIRVFQNESCFYHAALSRLWNHKT